MVTKGKTHLVTHCLHGKHQVGQKMLEKRWVDALMRKNKWIHEGDDDGRFFKCVLDARPRKQ